MRVTHADRIAAGVVRDAVVVLAGPGDEIFLGRLALLGALHPVGLVERAARRLQLVAHLVNERLTVKCHVHTLSRAERPGEMTTFRLSERCPSGARRRQPR